MEHTLFSSNNFLKFETYPEPASRFLIIIEGRQCTIYCSTFCEMAVVANFQISGMHTCVLFLRSPRGMDAFRGSVQCAFFARSVMSGSKI